MYLCEGEVGGRRHCHPVGLFLPSSHLSPEVQGSHKDGAAAASTQGPQDQNWKVNPGAQRGMPILGSAGGQSLPLPHEDATTAYQSLHRTGLLSPLLHHKVYARAICEVPEIFGKGEGTATALHCHFLFCYAALYHQLLPE